MVYAFLHLALALYRDYTTHKIYEGRKSKHVIILLMKKKMITTLKKKKKRKRVGRRDRQRQETQKRNKSRANNQGTIHRKSKWIIRMSKLHWPNQGKLVR